MAGRTRLKRPPVIGTHGAVTSCHPLASAAGLRVLVQGGNAFDAAVAAAAVNAVVNPVNCTAGGDAFALVYDAARGEVVALNAAGAAPLAATPARLSGGIPVRGIAAAVVPGAVDGWLALHDRYGRLERSEVFAPAIEYAEGGHAVTPGQAELMRHYVSVLARYPATARVFLPGGETPREGERLVQTDLAATLRAMVRGGREAFYQGGFGEALLACSREDGGLFGPEDLARPCSRWLAPLCSQYRGYAVYAQPPVSHGFLLLQMLNIVEGFDLSALGPGSALAAHLLIEAKKLAFADRHAFVGDPEQIAVPLAALLDKGYAAARRAAIDPARAGAAVAPGAPVEAAGGRDTTYLATADGDGNMVSFMQSVYRGFGSGVVVPGTGVLLNNRMGGFSPDPDSPNAVAPGKVPVHNMAPNLIGRDGRVFMALGTPGGYSQVQSNLQVLVNVLDLGMDLQRAIEAPRWVHGGITVDGLHPELTVDDGMAGDLLHSLAERGHSFARTGGLPPMPPGQNSERTTSTVEGIRVDHGRGTIWAAADPRSEAQAIAW